ncbi:hypothetical protein FA13DRAFT_366962 [Coprinellus micaceus]|uniref:ER-bound oxygenase mpaB/mpaB'/Rubber oxygenase catalytic domain-containing protein n=1 Tax=Coprinellus micaceus TaxID=71717 RepID=A0A4Y7TBB5_COPMI|nr:hypothetical protein FA13DRAFT_366962 [Coprinellus micaceus]
MAPSFPIPSIDWLHFWEDLTHPLTIATAVGTITILHLTLARALRWRRYYSIHREYEVKWKEGRLTPGEAQRIMQTSCVYDMPWLLIRALAFALFKTYTLPSGSKLLLSTRELGSQEKVAKRYADTEILIQTWIGCPLSGFHSTTGAPSSSVPAEDPRAALAIARTNFLHSKYNIPNHQFLYTLGLFILEPPAWAKRWGWRELSDMEQDAYLIFWTDIGQKMGIKDIPPTLEELKEWCETYAEAEMAPDEANHKLSEYTMDEILYPVPRAFGLREFGERAVICLLPDRVREAMLLPAQPRWLHWFVNSVFTSIWLYQRYLCFPRHFMDYSGFPINGNLPKPDKNGDIRARPRVYRSIPWYKPEPSGFLGRTWEQLLVKVGWHGGVPAVEFLSNGYRIEEVGPLRFQNLGIEETLHNAAKIQGCPIAKPWAPTTYGPSAACPVAHGKP